MPWHKWAGQDFQKYMCLVTNLSSATELFVNEDKVRQKKFTLLQILAVWGEELVILCKVFVEVAAILHVCGCFLAVCERVDIIIWGMVDEFHELGSFVLFFFIYGNFRDYLKIWGTKNVLNLDSLLFGGTQVDNMCSMVLKLLFHIISKAIKMHNDYKNTL